MRAWLEIDLGAIQDNCQAIRQEIGPNVEIIAVVKTDAYGHGLKKVVPVLDQSVGQYAVISLAEARQVRELSPKPILIMGYLDTKEVIDAIEENFVLTLYDKELIPIYERFAQRIGRVVAVELKVETGLNRLGLTPEAARDFLLNQRHFPHLKLVGVYSHLAQADQLEPSQAQLEILQRLLAELNGQDVGEFPVHLVSSYGLGHFRQGYLDAVRIGLALYGVDQVLPALRPALTCKSVVMQVKTVAKDEGISYGHLYRTNKSQTVAVIAIGYAEGLSQIMRDKLTVLIQGVERPVLGQICMNHIIVDVTGLNVRRGEEVVIIGSQKRPDSQVGTVSVTDLAKRVGLRHHEIIVRLGRALPKIYY